jgi:hypothetical protein
MRIDKIELSGSLLISSSLSRSPLRINDNYLYINPQGNIGIGTTNPTSKLVVTGSIAVQGQLRATTLSGSFTGSIKLPTIPLGTSETNIVLVDGSGGLVYRSNLSLTGAQGNQGTQGIQGIQGTVGTQGFQGFQGDTGAQGTQGTQGIQGTVGAQGSQGAQGIQGTVGTQGATGASAGITSYTNPADNRVLTSVNSTTINAESNLIFDGTNLGLGVTPSAWASNRRAFQIGTYSSMVEVAGYTIFGNNTYHNGTNNFYLNNGGASEYYMQGGQHIWNIAPSGTAGNPITFTQAMTLDASGRLGIGTTSPTFKLDVNGTGRFSGMITVTGVSEYLRSIQTGTSAQAQSWYASDETTRRAVFGFRSGGSDNFTLLNERNGSLLIGTNDATNLTIASTGAATFSSTATATKFIPQSGGSASGNGMYLPVANTLGFSTAGVERLRLTSTALGLGVTPKNTNSDLPTFQAGNATFAGSATSNVAYVGTNYYNDPVDGLNKFIGSGYSTRFQTDNGSYYFLTSNASGTADATISFTQAMTLDASGRLGIGTTPTYKLDVAGGQRINTSMATTVLEIYNTDTNDGNGVFIKAGGVNSTKYALVIQNAASTNLMTVLANGNVGIGTASPNAKLQIEGNDLIMNTENSYQSKSIYFRFSNGATILSDSDLRFSTGAPSEKMRITSGGNVGIGTTAPVTKLQVVGGNISIDADQPIRKAGDNAIIGYSSTLPGITIGSGTTTDMVAFYAGGTERVRINTSGNVGIGRTPTTNILEIEGNASKTTAGDWLANSDSTIKTEIHTIDGALDRINKVRLVSFKYKDEYKLLNPSIKDKFYQNVIAQEYQEIYPDYVYESGDIFEDKNILQVDTNPMYIDAVASIQQLSAQVDILKQEIINLKNN